MDNDTKSEIKAALTTTKDEFTSEYQAISMLQESNAQIQIEITKTIQTENQKNQTIIEQEVNRTEAENQLEIKKENFLLEMKKTNDQIANERLNLLNQMHQIDDRRLLLLQKHDYNQHIIENLKSQEKEYLRLENLYQNQYDQAESMIKSITTANETHLKELENNSMISKKDEKIKQLRQSIQNLDILKNETKDKIKYYVNKSKELQNEIVNYRTSQMNQFNEKIDDESQKAKKYNNTVLQMQDNTDTINRKISMLNKQINDIENQINQIYTFQNSQKSKIETRYSKISEIKENANDIRHQSAEMRDKLTNFLQNHSMIQKARSENKKVSAKLKIKCDELTNLYKVETKLNKMLPELLTACCEADATFAELENSLNQINEEIENQSFNDVDINQKIKLLEKELSKLEEKLKIEKTEENQLKLMTNIDNSEDSFGFRNFKRVKTEKEMKIKTQIKKVKKQILSILLQTKEIKMVIDRQNRSKEALIKIMKENKNQYDLLKECHENNTNPIFRMQKNGNAKKIQSQIRNLEIRIGTKKEIIQTMKRNLYNKSSLFVHTIHKTDRNDLASTNSLNCDPVTKSIVLKNHDKYCGIEHECTALNLLCKLESTKESCVFCNKYNLPVG